MNQVKWLTGIETKQYGKEPDTFMKARGDSLYEIETPEYVARVTKAGDKWLGTINIGKLKLGIETLCESPQEAATLLAQKLSELAREVRYIQDKYHFPVPEMKASDIVELAPPRWINGSNSYGIVEDAAYSSSAWADPSRVCTIEVLGEDNKLQGFFTHKNHIRRVLPESEAAPIRYNIRSIQNALKLEDK